MKKLTIKLTSSLVRHGQSEVRRSQGNAAVNKLSKMLGLDSSKPSNKKEKKPKKAINEPGKDYLTNSSSTRSFMVHDIEFDGDFGIIRHTANALMNLPSVDYNQMKLDYKAVKDAAYKDIAEKFSNFSVLPESASIALQEKLHEKSFLIWKHQLTFIIWSDEEFEGGTYDEDRKVYVAATVSKAVYTLEPLTKVQLSILVKGSEDITNKKLRAVAKQLVRIVEEGNCYFRPLKANEDLDDFL